MTTQQLYQKVINEQMSKSDFLWNVRRDDRFSSIVSNTMSFEDTVSVLKGKGHVWENNQESSAVRPFDFMGSMKALSEAAKKENKMKGGKGDKLDADRVNYHEFTKGWKHELEHTDDIDKAKEIALDHLAEDPNYYTRLDMIEYQAEKSKKKTASKKTKEGAMVDSENQMTAVDKKKAKSNVKAGLGKQEKAKSKNAGAKVMKGGSGEMKSVKESFANLLPAKKAQSDNEQQSKTDFEKALKKGDFDDVASMYVDDIVYADGKYQDEYKKMFYDYLDNEEIKELSDIIKTTLDNTGSAPGHEDDYKLEPKGIDTLRKQSDLEDIDEVDEKPETLQGFDPFDKKAVYVWKFKGNSQSQQTDELDKELYDYLISKKDKLLYLKKVSNEPSGPIKPEKEADPTKDPTKFSFAALKKAKDDKKTVSFKTKGELKSDIDPNLAFDPNQMYMYRRKNDRTFSASVLDQDQFDSLKNDPALLVLKKTTPEEIAQLDPTKAKATAVVDEPKADSSDKGSYVGVKRKSIPNLGIKQIQTTPSTGKKWQVIDMSEPGKPRVKAAFDEREKAKKYQADSNNPNLKVVNYLELKKIAAEKGIDLKPLEEALDDTTKKGLESANVSFIIPGEGDADQKLDVSDTVKSAVYNKKDKSFTINLNGGNRVVFTPDASGKPVGVYFSKQDNEEVSKQILDIQPPLSAAVNKVYASKKEEEPTVNETLENYIRERIRKAIKEGEEGQYIGMIGPDVLKKKLKEYMARYEWGFQESGNPATKARGSEIHGIVSKMVNQLGDEGVEIFNDFAPENYQIKNVMDLGADPAYKVGLGPQDRDFNPEELTGRGGRVAEAAYDEEDVKRYTDVMDKNIDDAGLEKDMADFGEKAMTNAFGNPAAQSLVARILGEYIARKGAQNIKNSNIIRGFHKLADKNK
jgi:hypothetical protein